MICSPQNISDKNLKLRQTNIELLRIIAMIMIIAHHFAFHGGFEFPIEIISINRLWIQFIQLGGKIGVNIFVIISGYFLINAQNIKTSKVLKMWLQIFFYSFFIFAIFVLLGLEPFSFKQLLKSILPIISGKWWFASSYFVLYLISPFLNKMLLALDKIVYKRFLILIAICWCIIPTFTGSSFESNNLLWFIFLYALVGYIKIHSKSTNIKSSKYILSALFITILTYLSAVIFDIIGLKSTTFALHSTFFYSMQSLPVLAISLLTFLGFLKLNIKYNRIINIISSATFGVYLIHDNPLIRSFLFNTIFKNASYSESKVLIPYSLLVIFVVYIGCTIIELLRKYVLENNYMKLINKIALKIDKLIDKMLSSKIISKM